jgi:hypothetical protein
VAPEGVEAGGDTGEWAARMGGAAERLGLLSGLCAEQLMTELFRLWSRWATSVVYRRGAVIVSL